MITPRRPRSGATDGSRWLAAAVGVALAAIACAPSVTPAPRVVEASSLPAAAVTPSPAAAAAEPAPSPTTGPSPTAAEWMRAADIAQPAGFMTVLKDASGQPYMGGCAPCHPAIDTIMTDVVDGPAGLVAVGWVIQGFRGASWHSRDGSTWTYTGDFPDGTLLTSVAADGERYVAVGRNGESATAWSSTDGVAWTRTSSAAAFAETPLRLTSVTAWRGGFVAGGFRGSDFFSATAAFWDSRDGRTWTRAAGGPDLADARVFSITTGGPGLVAVGQAGPADHPGPAVVWTSPDGARWTRIADSPVFHDARMRAVASVHGIGIVAVGEDLAGDAGIVWASPDGIQWDRVPPAPLFGRPGIQVRMYDVTASPSGAVVVGTVTEGIQYGVGAVWTSPDGVTWSRTGSPPELLDTEINAAAPWHDRVVAVGDRGAPDAYQATAWVGPRPTGR